MTNDNHSFVFKVFNGIFIMNSGFPSLKISTPNQDKSKITVLRSTNIPKWVTENDYGRSHFFLTLGS